jgi:BMFP domain-containing protein YqiC
MRGADAPDPGEVGPHRGKCVKAVIDSNSNQGNAMPQSGRVLDELTAKIREMIAASPERDVEKNLRALLAAGFARLDLATREELEVQSEVLARTREKLGALEARVAELEARLRQP